jgi:hypothetical protein
MSFGVIFSGGLREMKSKKIKTHYTLQKFYRKPCFGFGSGFGWWWGGFGFGCG